MREIWRPALAPLEPSRAAIAALAAAAFGECELVAAEPLPHGLVNANFRVVVRSVARSAARDRTLLLRYWRRSGEDAGKELALLDALAPSLPVPARLASGRADPEFGLPYAFLSFVEGCELGAALAATTAGGARLAASLGASLGASLAAIHAFVFARQGFFGADLIPRGAFDMEVEGQLAWLGERLDSGAAARLGAVVTRLERCVACGGRLLASDWARRPCLTHADFDPSNILVRGTENPEVAAVLDWEFAFAGGPAFDFGRLLRPPLGEDDAFIERVCAGYRAAGGELPADWRRPAMMADLLSLVDFAAQPFCGADAARSVSEHAARLVEQLVPT